MRSIVTLFIAFRLSAATYYVDQSAGNDANPGTEGSPWKNCPGMFNEGPLHTGSGVLAAGDTVYFDRSDTWSVSKSDNSAVFLVGGVAYYGNVWGSGMGQAKFRAVDHIEGGVVRFFDDHPTFETIFEGFEIDGQGNIASGVDVNGRFFDEPMIGAWKIMRDLYVHDLDADGGAGEFRYGIFISDNSTDESGRVANVLMERVEAARVARDGFAFYPVAGSISNIWAINCISHGIRLDESYQEGHGFLIKGDTRDSGIRFCMATNVNSSALFINGPEAGPGPGPSNFLAEGCIFQTGDNNGAIRIFGTGTKSAVIVGCIVLENEPTGGFNMSGCEDEYNIQVLNTTFFDAYINVDSPVDPGTLTFKNCIFYEQDDIPFQDTAGDTDTISNCLFYRVTGGTTLASVDGVTYTSADITMLDANALAEDPLFENTANLPTGFTGVYGFTMQPNATGLKLSELSNARNAGQDLGATYDFSINSIHRNQAELWDMGAYQYGSPLVPLVNRLKPKQTAVKGMIGL